jgi:hypothetical protein
LGVYGGWGLWFKVVDLGGLFGALDGCGGGGLFLDCCGGFWGRWFRDGLGLGLRLGLGLSGF